MPQNEIQSTTQKFLEIYDISDNVVILKDGSCSMVMTVNAMNFGLLAEPEQDAIMYAYAGLLNSLNYPVQIVIRSQTKDVTSYLGLLKDEEDQTTSAVKKQWINRYRGFVSQLIKERNVLDKKFYLIVMATNLEMGLLPASTVIPGVKQPDLSTIERSVILDKARELLEPRRDHLLGQLSRIGLFGHQLTTQEIIQLFYLSYNPEAAEGQQITDTQSYTTPVVEASVQQGGLMDNPTNQPSTPSAAAPSSDAPPTIPTPPTTSVTPTPPMTPPMGGTPPTTPGIATPPLSGMPAASQTPSMPPTPSASPEPISPGGATMPSITPPANPGMTPSTQPADTGAEAAAQNEINSTLQQLGDKPALENTPTAPSVGTPTTGTPAVTPVATDDKNAASSMPPLPEI